MPDIRIMTWNTHGWDLDSTKTDPEKKLKIFLDYVEHGKFDIIALQEMKVEIAKKTLLPALNLLPANKKSKLNYEIIDVKNTLPGMHFDERGEKPDTEFEGKRALTNDGEDDSYVIFFQDKFLSVNAHFMPKYLGYTEVINHITLGKAQDTTNSGRSSRRIVDLTFNELAKRRPYYVQFSYPKHSKQKIHFLCWHAPEGGNNHQDAMPAIRLLLMTRFGFMPSREVGDNIILVGDLNAQIEPIKGALGAAKLDPENWKKVSNNLDHILAYSVSECKPIPNLNNETDKVSDHKAVAATITLEQTGKKRSGSAEQGGTNKKQRK